MTPQKSLFVDPCSTLEPPTHPRGDPHCLVSQRERCWRVTNSTGGCCSQGKLHPGWSGGAAWNAFGFFFFFSLFLFICNKCRRGGDSKEVFAQNPAQSQDHVWLPDRLVLGPGRELPAAPRPKWCPGAAAPAPAPRRAAPTWPSQEHRVPLFVADNEKLERRQKRTTKMIQGLEKMPCSRSPK